MEFREPWKSRTNSDGLRDANTIPYKIVVSLRNKTLKLYESDRLIKTYLVAIGRTVKKTPQGEFIIVNRQANPGGPFGAYWLGLSKEGYGIHGTNNPSSIGKAVSKGCIRMYNRDVRELASIVPNSTPVIITP
ncbi:L,D-transpeptidase [Bacillus sp. CLL-7-23]|uniref:L,D-transpeptidase n=1 Tax=Bacillus changyiensis TaxID=3004103 RepID=A0ABT4X1W2_9BACI|nr:L,D-transpeptidase [Bacillus changyiensis]